ncbi:MAG: H(+)/Cl(-) exchange transporter ClcA [Draconibacterium sp.]
MNKKPVNSIKDLIPADLTIRFRNADVKNFKLIFFAIIVGLLAGFAGSAFRLILSYIEGFSNNLYENAGNSGWLSGILPVVVSIAGIGIAVWLVRSFAAEASGSGVQEIEGALDELRVLRWKKVIPVKFIGSLLSLGSGLLLGREGPTIQIGASLGKMIKDIFKKADLESNSLISAGAAAGLASAFNAPFSGIIFVVEEMYGHFKYTFFSVAAIMVASATADYVSRMLIGASPVIKMIVFPNPPLNSFWMFIVLGVLLSFIGLIFNRLLIKVSDFFSGMKKPVLVVTLVGVGLIIAVIGILNPLMIGGGYNTIRAVLDESHTIQFLLMLFAGRMLLTVLSYGTGAPGGIFAPLIAIGVVIGMLFGSIMQHYFPEFVIHPGIFAVAGMAGIFASTVRAPLTGVILAVEMTSNFELILPLIFTTLTASLVTTQLGNQPIYTTLLKRTLKR